jgi:hypothetical protein
MHVLRETIEEDVLQYYVKYNTIVKQYSKVYDVHLCTEIEQYSFFTCCKGVETTWIPWWLDND